jgi:Protein of unknown function (DUF551)
MTKITQAAINAALVQSKNKIQEMRDEFIKPCLEAFENNINYKLPVFELSGSQLGELIDGAIKAAAPHIIAQHEGEKWQLIETAPKDGSKFWGKVGEDVTTMFWHESLDCFCNSYRRMTMANGHTFEGGEITKDHSPNRFNPTHWIPLPQPPKEA